MQDFQIFAKPGGALCNLACSYCYYAGPCRSQHGEAQPLMPESLLERYILQHIAASRSDVINFSWHGGEPTLAGVNYFQRVVELQHQHCPVKRRITNGMQTNGTLLDAEWGAFLSASSFTVGLSLDGPRENHDRYRRNRSGGATFEAAMRGYRILVEHGVPVDILCVVNDDNVMYPLQVYEFFKEIGANHISFLPLVEPVWHGSQLTVGERSVQPEEFGGFLCTIFDAWMASDIGRVKIQLFEETLRTAFAQEHSLCLFRPVCGEIPVLEKDGDVYACDHFVEPDWLVGNIVADELTEILQSARLRQFGERKRQGLSAACRSCDVLAMCNGECPKNRFVTVEGEEQKQNYLCPGYKLFFTHCRPFIEAVALQWQHEKEQSDSMGSTGRNVSCPCGSGRKYKRCCGR